jgi:hypothetical protein
MSYMSTCLDAEDLMRLSEASLDDVEKRLSGIPSDLCAPFYAEADKLEQQLLGVYRTVALCVRKEDDLNSITVWWDTMTNICDKFAARLNDLCAAHPYCGAEVFYDHVLDLRNRCLRLANLHR